MKDTPKVGDIWVGEDLQGNPVERTVTEVVPVYGGDPLISLDGSSLCHVGWWYGQGWSEKEDE